MKEKLAAVFGHPYFAFSLAFILFLSIVSLVALASFAIMSFSVAPPYPDSSAIVEEQSFGEYVGLVGLTFDFLTKVIGVLIAVLILTLALLGVQMYVWSRDRRKMARWREVGLVIERLEFRSGNRLRLNHLELELNRAQMNTLRALVKQRCEGEPLHPADLPGDNGTQMMKRLREELGARLLEQALIKNRRSKGYWIEINPNVVRDDDPEADHETNDS